MIAPVAYRHCEEVTRSRAGNFYYGIRLLPPPKRRAMCAVYAFARRVDDIGEQLSPLTERIRERVLARLASLEPKRKGSSRGGPANVPNSRSKVNSTEP